MRTAVWATFFLLNVSTALKGTHNYIFYGSSISLLLHLFLHPAELDTKMNDNYIYSHRSISRHFYHSFKHFSAMKVKTKLLQSQKYRQ